MAGNKVGRRSVTLRDVAAAARVHVATASRALDSQTAHPVSPETRARVKRVAEELGYQHHMMARGLRRGFSSTVGVVVADLGNPYTAPILRGLQSRLEGADYMALMTESLDDSQVLQRAVGHLLARQVDGLLLLAVRSGDLDRVLGWASRVPVVLAVRSLPGSGVPAVTHDDLGGARLAASAPGRPRPPPGRPAAGTAGHPAVQGPQRRLCRGRGRAGPRGAGRCRRPPGRCSTRAGG